MNKNELSKKIEKYLLKNKNKIKINTSDLKKGDVFIALKGKNTHGNLFIDKAISKGAKYVIASSYFQILPNTKNVLVVNNTLNFLKKIADKKRNLFKGKVIGLTGSVGKTTLKENLKFFLSAVTKVSVSIKSYNNFLGVLISVININLKDRFAVFEIGTNNFKEIRKLTSIILPEQTIITNINPTHLENFKNTRNIAIEKSDIFNHKYNKKIELSILPNFNKDESWIISKAKKGKYCDVITFGNKKKSNVFIQKVNYTNKLYRVTIKYFEKNFQFDIGGDQKHQIQNTIICLIIFIYNNLNLKIFFKKALNIPKIDGRGLTKKIFINKKKVNFIDESYNASPTTMENILNYFKDIKINKKNNKFLILGDMHELGRKSKKFHLKIVNLTQDKKIKNIILCGKAFKSVLINIKSIKKNIIYLENEDLILKYLEEKVHNNDTILIKCSNTTIVNNLAKMLNKMKKVQ